jgi:sugar fermentation stimulation protein A
MRLPALLPAVFLRRDNRFYATVRLEGREVGAHVANPGRCQELLVPGGTVWLAAAQPGPARKTAYTLALAEHRGALVSMRSFLANDLVAEALAQALAAGEPFLGMAIAAVEREVRRGHSRFDFRLTLADGALCWVEVKSVTLVEGRVALFPDAPTARGARHLSELAELALAGARALALFVIQRPDADRCAPHAVNDPAFARALGAAVSAGVEARALRCRVSLQEIAVEGEVPMEAGGISPQRHREAQRK